VEHATGRQPASGAAVSGADKAIRGATVAAVACVGLVAAVLSYRHQFELAAGHGESPLTARLVPFSIDGLLLAGTLAVLDAARHARGPAWAARITVALGVAMTLWANVVHGLAYGPAGVVISGWPPVALIAAVEVLARMVRPAAAPAQERAGAAALSNGYSAPEGARGAARIFADDLARGELPSVRRVRREMHVGQPRAQEVHAYLSALRRDARAAP
jgi:hypothetical protein